MAERQHDADALAMAQSQAARRGHVAVGRVRHAHRVGRAGDGTNLDQVLGTVVIGIAQVRPGAILLLFQVSEAIAVGVLLDVRSAIAVSIAGEGVGASPVLIDGCQAVAIVVELGVVVPSPLAVLGFPPVRHAVAVGIRLGGLHRRGRGCHDGDGGAVGTAVDQNGGVEPLGPPVVAGNREVLGGGAVVIEDVGSHQAGRNGGGSDRGRRGGDAVRAVGRQDRVLGCRAVQGPQTAAVQPQRIATGDRHEIQVVGLRRRQTGHDGRVVVAEVRLGGIPDTHGIDVADEAVADGDAADAGNRRARQYSAGSDREREAVVHDHRECTR